MRHKADIGCCNFVEHEIELEENAVPHREGARRMTPHKSEACRKEMETLLEYDMIEPSKSPWACGVVMAKKKARQGQNRVRLRVGAVSMETDAIWSLKCQSHISTVDGTCADRCDKEVRQPGNVLRG